MLERNAMTEDQRMDARAWASMLRKSTYRPGDVLLRDSAIAIAELLEAAGVEPQTEMAGLREALEPWQFQPDEDSPGLYLQCVSKAQRDAIIKALSPEARAGLLTESQPVEETDPRLAAADYLFGLLDDIDTLDDACRSDDAAFREAVRQVQRRRFEVASTDGYSVTFKKREIPVAQDKPVDAVRVAVEALERAAVWHEDQAKALSKQPQTGDIGWRRNEHGEQAEQLRAAITAMKGAGL
jgi:hypothetical protein